MCTHEPTTFLDPGCEQKFGDKRDAVVCAGQMAADFIEWVQKQNFYHNTVITVPGDHVVRGKNSIYPQRSKRQIFFTIINPQKGSEPQKHRRTMLDIAPTLSKPPVSETMGAPGQNLWKQHPALEEKYGLALDTEINKFSTSPEPGLKKPCSYTLGMKATNPADIVRYTLAHYKKVQTVWTDNLYLKTDFSQAENICPDIEFIVMFEKRDKPAAITCRLTEKARTNGQFSPMSKRRFVKNRFYPKHNRQ